MDPQQRLDPIGLGLGAANGYSGADLTNPRQVVLAGEVPYLAQDGSTPHADPVLELRIHGVGGAPPEANVQSPSTVQVAGDGTAGFFRAWYPGGTASGRPRREAYCWGGLNTRATSRAFYLLLVAFMMVNVAYWALPARPRPRPQTPTPKDSDEPRPESPTERLAIPVPPDQAGPGSPPPTEPLAVQSPAGKPPAGQPQSLERESAGNQIARATLRVLGLALTVAFFATAVTLLADLVGWQAPMHGGLPSWLGWYSRRDRGPRLAMSLLTVLALLGGLMWLSIATVRSYERWGERNFTDAEPGWALTHSTFWHGERSVNRQRNAHVIAVAALVMMFAVLPHSSANALRVVALVVAAALGMTALVLVAIPWADRFAVAAKPEQWSDIVVMWVARAAVACAIAASVARFWWRVDSPEASLPASQLTLVITAFAEFGLIVILAVAVLVQRPWRAGKEVLGLGFAAPLLATLAAVISTIFGSSITLAVANVIGSPRVATQAHGASGATLLLPSTVYVGGAGMVVAVLALLCVGGYLVGWSSWEAKRLARRGHDAPPDAVPASYPDAGGPEAVASVARTWATSALTDRAAIVLVGVAVPTALVLVVHQIVLQAGTTSAFLQKVAAVGGTIGVAATVYFFAVLRSALVNSSERRRFGLLWDVGTFWPRACHPFGPPCYAERSIPEVVVRVRRLVGDVVRHPRDPALAQQDADGRAHRDEDPYEKHSPVLLTGYSQGTPISIAVMAQLPGEVRAHTALLTLAAPIRRLYGRTFPAYFGPDQLGRIRMHLTDPGASADPKPDDVRWRNLTRRSDYIGGLAFLPATRPADHALVDRYILDPPALWDDTDPSPPPRHRHSGWFPDPQVLPYAQYLQSALRRDFDLGGTGGDGDGTGSGTQGSGQSTRAAEPDKLGS